MIEIFKELPGDMLEVEELLDLTFGSGRNALSSYRYRDGIDPVSDLCLLMRDEYNVLVGVVRFWPVLIGSKNMPSLLLGPLGVHPTRQGEGLGEILINDALEKAKSIGWTRVILVGDLSYYQRFGFSRNATDGIYLEKNIENKRLLGAELVSGSMHKLSGPVTKWLRLNEI